MPFYFLEHIFAENDMAYTEADPEFGQGGFRDM